MRLLRIGPPGAERPALLTDGRYFDLTPVTTEIDGPFLAADGIAEIRRVYAAGALAEIDVTDLRIGAPVARPGALLCIGMNYAAHAAESGAPPPAEPVLFYKAPNTVVGPHDDIPIPPGSVKTDWEVELAIVIGRRASYLTSPRLARDHIAGYAVSNDLSEREYQLERSNGQWSKGKSCPGFNPLGPWLVPADSFDPANARLRSWVNGAPRQDSGTADMIFNAEYLVWYLSQFTVLDPGDIINTGTPEGVALSGRFPYLTAGDTVEVEVEALGRQRATCIPTLIPATSP